jgi:hypothetical protein
MKRLLVGFAACAATLAWAGEHGLPVNTPAAYKTECGSCHAAFPPALLAASDWRKTMARLDRHFGTDASLDAPTHGRLAKYLEDHAGRRAASTKADEPRFTTGAWFVREHREVPTRVWSDLRVKTPSNCGACHKGADQGRYGEREIQIPGLGRRDHD